MLRNFKTLSRAIITSTVILSYGAMAHATSPEIISRQALDLAGTQNFSEALRLIDTQKPEIRDSYDVRFTKARILSWADKHKKSERVFEELMRDYPGNPDIQSGYGYLEYYRGNYDLADMHFRNILQKYPDYTDATKGLELTQKARRSQRGYEWRIDVNAGVNSFDTDLSNWNHQSVRAEYNPNDMSVAFNAGATRYERFDATDIQFMAGARSSHKGPWNWEIGGGFTPDSDFRPKTTALVRGGYSHKLEGGHTLHTSIGYQMDDYKNANTIHTLTPEVTAYLTNEVTLTGRLIHVMQDSEDDQTGWLLSGEVPITDRLYGRLGYAMAPEAVNGVAIDTESIFGGLRYQLSEQTDMHLTLSRDDRENSYVRDGVNVGLTQRY